MKSKTKKPTKTKSKKSKKDKGDVKALGPASFIKGLVSDLEEMGGPGTAQVLGSDAHAIKIRGVISTQSRTLDAAIGRGGIPLGRITVLHGREGCGKTTMCLHLCAEVQKQGGVVLYIDKEYKLDPDYARKIGVDVDHMIISQPSHLERVYEIIIATIKKAAAWRKATKKRVPILIVLDSLNAAIAKARLEGEVEDKHVAPEARVHSENIPKMLDILHKEDVAMVYVSQYRANIGKMFGDKNETAGGNAPKYYASLMLKVEYIGKEKDGGEAVANKTRVTCVKNQIAPPFKQAEFEIKYGIGIDRVATLLDAAMDAGIVTKKGSWFNYGKKRLGQGRPSALDVLRENESLMEQIELDLLSDSTPDAEHEQERPKKRREDDEDDEGDEDEDEESDDDDDEDDEE